MPEAIVTPEDILKVNQAVHELKALVVSNTMKPEVMANIDKVLDGYEKKNQELVQHTEHIKGAAYEIALLKNELESKGVEAGAIRTQVEAMEVEFARATARGTHGTEGAYRDSDEFKALNRWCAVGDHGIKVEEKALLRTDSAVDGGTLVLTEMDTVILKKITELDGFRSLARVRTIGSKTLELPVRTGIPTATFEGEAAEGTDSASAYGNETITPYRQTFTTPITRDMLMDSAFNMEQEITGDAGEAFAFGEGNGFIAGSGNKVPEGIVTNATLIAAALTATANGPALKINPMDVILMAGELKVGYEPSYMLHRRTLASLRTFRIDSGGGGGTGSPLWAPAIDSSNPATLNGHSYTLMPSMPQEGSATLALAFGDFRRGYTIVDRTGMSVIRDEFTLKKRAIVEFTMQRWVTGKVVLPEAMILQKCA